MNMFLRPVLWVVAVGMIVGCGDSKTTVDLPFASNEPISELTSDEMKEVCDQTVEALRHTVGTSVCSFTGILVAVASKTSCADARAECIENMFDRSTCAEEAMGTVNCDAQVKELESCLNDLIKNWDALIPNVSCSTRLADIDEVVFGELDQLEFPQSCVDLTAECVGIDLDFLRRQLQN